MTTIYLLRQNQEQGHFQSRHHKNLKPDFSLKSHWELNTSHDGV